MSPPPFIKGAGGIFNIGFFLTSVAYTTENRYNVRQLYQEYKESPNLLQLVREIPWGQNIAIMSKVKDSGAREYYLRVTVEMGWSRNVLIRQIEGGAFELHRIAKKLHNFDLDLPQYLAEQADLAIKDSYSLKFLGLGRAALEREMENRMIKYIRDVLLELDSWNRTPGAGSRFCLYGQPIFH
jgi:predicted nuclease of restriction endonuclease-like (RecB) superfamily